MAQINGRSSLIASALAAIGATACCVGPLVLLAFGIGGSWIGHLTAMEPYRPVLVGLTLVFLGLAFHQLYLIPQACEPGTACTDPRTVQRQRQIFWTTAIVLLTLLAAPLLAPLFY